LVDDAAGTLTRTSQSGGFGGAHWELDRPDAPDAPARATTDLRRPFFQAAEPDDYTGVWLGDDGATYYVRHLLGLDLPGSKAVVVWYAESKTAAHVFAGTVAAGGTVQGTWADLPRGGTKGTGTLTVT